MVASFKKEIPQVESNITEFFDQDYEAIFNEKMEKFANSDEPVPVNFVKSKEVFEGLKANIWTLE